MSRFGRAALADWPLDPSVRYLNHGTVGVTPRAVLARQQALRDEMERGPSQFMLRRLAPMLGPDGAQEGLIRQAARAVAAFVHARPEDLGFVTNVTAGINAVLRALRFAPGDEVLLLDHAYGAVVNAARGIAGAQGAAVVTATLPDTLRGPDDVIDAVSRALTPRTRLAILDHVTSSSALVLPIRELVQLCATRGVPVLVDGAHAPGAVRVHVEEIGAQFYAANLHKWAWTPRSCGFLHARADAHAGLHAPILSWGLDQGLARELDWQGTYDPTPMLCAPEGIAQLTAAGGDDVMAYNRARALRALDVLSDRLGAEALAPSTMIGTMITLRLPFAFGSTPAHARALRDRLLDDERIELQVHAHRERVHVRFSGQVYVEDDDIDALAAALTRLRDQRVVA